MESGEPGKAGWGRGLREPPGGLAPLGGGERGAGKPGQGRGLGGRAGWGRGRGAPRLRRRRTLGAAFSRARRQPRGGAPARRLSERPACSELGGPGPALGRRKVLHPLTLETPLNGGRER